VTTPLPIDRLTWRDEPTAVATLAAAFAEYPLLVLLCPNAKRRPRVVEAFCRVLFRMSVRCDAAFGTADRAAVVCVWPPGHEWPSSWQILRPSGFAFLWQLGLRGTRLLSRIEREFDVARVQHVTGPHYYIPLLGVRPDSQGKGLSRAVLRPVFEAADLARLPIYLETATEPNVAIYKRFGFALRGHRELPGGLPNWEMVRNPPEATPAQDQAGSAM
jgi:ribosomal protein S18 acetylase RimI-like enzyme